MMISVVDRVEKIVGKGENKFSTNVFKSLFFRVVKTQDCVATG